MTLDEIRGFVDNLERISSYLNKEQKERVVSHLEDLSSKLEEKLHFKSNEVASLEDHVWINRSELHSMEDVLKKVKALAETISSVPLPSQESLKHLSMSKL